MQKEKNRWFISFIKHIFKRPLGYSHLEKTGKCPLTMKWNVFWASKNHIPRGEKAKIVKNAYGKGWEPLGAYIQLDVYDVHIILDVKFWWLSFFSPSMTRKTHISHFSKKITLQVWQLFSSAFWIGSIVSIVSIDQSHVPESGKPSFDPSPQVRYLKSTSKHSWSPN